MSIRATIPNLLSTRDQFRGIRFFHGPEGRGKISGLFKHITYIVHFVSIIITSVPPQIIRYWILVVRDPWIRGQNISPTTKTPEPQILVLAATMDPLPTFSSREYRYSSAWGQPSGGTSRRQSKKQDEKGDSLSHPHPAFCKMVVFPHKDPGSTKTLVPVWWPSPTAAP